MNCLWIFRNFQTVILWRIGKRPFIVLFDFVSLQLVIYIFKVFSYFFPFQLALFPPQALVSPVADVLRQKLSVVAWGRRGLGLPSKEKNKQKDTVRKSYFGFGVLVIAVTVLFFSLSCMEFLWKKVMNLNENEPIRYFESKLDFWDLIFSIWTSKFFLSHVYRKVGDGYRMFEIRKCKKV